MKIFIAILTTVVSLNLWAGVMVGEILTKRKGQSTLDNGTCEFVLMRMHHWEGEYSLFFEGPGGKFRVDIHPSDYPLKEGELKTYDNAKLTYKGGTLYYRAVEAEGFGRKSVESVRVKIDPELKYPETAVGADYYQAFIKKDYYESIGCNF